MTPLQSAASGSRTHILFLGRMNAGKSSLINAFTGQEVSIVSSTPGTTTDAVKKPMEIHGIGPCILIDTAGFDDTGELGDKRIKATMKAAEQADLAVMLFAGDADWPEEKRLAEALLERDLPVIGVIPAADLLDAAEKERRVRLVEQLNIPAAAVSAVTGEGLEKLKELMIAAASMETKPALTAGIIEPGGTCMLVMPQDPQAPEGRLILPQVQTIRDLLDRNCIITCVTPEKMDAALAVMKEPPSLIITDSQVFASAYRHKPEGSRLTSFSVLFAAFRGDIRSYRNGAAAMDTLTEDSKVLIAEICTHAPMAEDIGRVKIPAMLRKRVGQGLTVDICAGSDFPEDLGQYDLIIQCGGCMFNRRHILSRIRRAEKAGVPITNYGIAIASLQGILDKIELPGLSRTGGQG